MTPTRFDEANKILTKPAGMTDEECGSLPTYADGHQTISCWRPTWRERLSILFFGRVWLQVMFGKTQPPVALSGARTIFEKPQGGRHWWWSSAFLLAALALSLVGCTTIVCAIWSPDGCPGTGAYDACSHKNPPDYCCNPARLGAQTPSPYCKATPTEAAR